MTEALNSSIRDKLATLKAAYLATPYPSNELRKQQLKKLSSAIIENKSRLVDAAKADFSMRSDYDSLVADIIPTISHIKYLSKHLDSWMKPHSRSAGWQFLPSKVWIEYVPKGVIGVIAPWNYPIQLALVPLATAIAAGNKVMLKLSELTPTINQVIKDVLEPLEGDCVVIEGDAYVASEFSQQAFDHLFFTGSTHIGKQVYAAAAKNLVPVTLELGGKSPMVVLDDANQDKAILDIIHAKTMNAGQICVAPDYVLVTESIFDEFIEKLKNKVRESSHSKGHTGIVNQHHAHRLMSLISDAQGQGTEVYSSKPLESLTAKEFGIHIIIEPSLKARVMQEEVFGPIVTVLKVQDLEHAKRVVQSLGTPLACYLYTNSEKSEAMLRRSLQAGSLCINDMLLHVAVVDLPFGGLGSSGMGQYHAKEGFIALSHGKSIFKSSDKIWRSQLFDRYSHIIKHVLTWLYLR
ncbi:aldehyde dehydrogenase family protein [Pseudoalteromonas luteoviolacea]|uniref:aldehyde dehydrogenase family protein n=1 Tax=Pseudoalteromonas luteoviolacea TaxID=43657 RepID=UPI001B370E3A|nr:aldehyde dehydrogenase family protein [Pseudoalteromonas luteoviolacea]